MRKLTLALALLISGSAFVGCSTNKEKKEEAQEDVNKAATELTEAKSMAETDSLNAVSVEEWKLFKTDTEAKIKSNEIRIEYLKKSAKKSGNMESSNQIDALEEQNKSLENRLKSYEMVKSDWISFKREFGHDLDQLGTALKDFTVPNKK